MLSLGFILAFIGAAVGLLIGITIFGGLSDSIECQTNNGEYQKACEDSIDNAWTIIGILPVVLFFTLFAIFGISGTEWRPNLSFFTRTHKETYSTKYTSSEPSLLLKILLMLGLAKKTERK